MSRIIAIVAVALSLTAGVAQADPLKDSIRYEGHITTGGLWDAR